MSNEKLEGRVAELEKQVVQLHGLIGEVAKVFKPIMNIIRTHSELFVQSMSADLEALNLQLQGLRQTSADPSVPAEMRTRALDQISRLESKADRMQAQLNAIRSQLPPLPPGDTGQS